MEKIYIDICDNFKLFLRLHNKRLGNSFLKRKILLLQFFFFSKLLNICEKNYRRKRIIIIHIDKNKGKNKLAKKLNKMLISEDINKVILSKQLQELVKDSPYYSIQDYFQAQNENKSNYYKELTNVIQFVLAKNNSTMAENNIYALAKEYHTVYQGIFTELAKKCKSINIVTPAIKEYQQLEENIYRNLGVYITVSNNKRKSLSRAQYIINIDCSQEEIKRYSISRNAIIFNISPYKITYIKGFEGTIINNVTFQENDYSFTRMIDRRFDEVYDDNYTIVGLLGNNGTISKIMY